MPIQQLFLGTGSAVATKTYVDDVFSTYLYSGTGSNSGSAQTITNGIDLAGEGGLVMSKVRNKTYSWGFTDTVRGVNKFISSNNANAETTTTGDDQGITSFNNNGFTLGKDNVPGIINYGGDGSIYTTNTFRKAPGFFDVVTYTGDGNTSQQISHSLGCVPGMVIVKCTSSESSSMSWYVYHRTTGNTRGLYLNGVGTGDTSSGFWNNTSPTSTHFTVSDADPGAVTTNIDSATYVAYVFAGGESTAATARSVDFDGTGDYLSVPASSDFSFGTGDFTIEGWIYKDTNSHNKCIFTLGDTGTTGGSGEATSLGLNWSNSNRLIVFGDGNYIISNSAANNTAPVGQWIHFALVKNSGVLTLYTNGVPQASYNSSQQWGAGSSNYLTIGATKYDGAFSNEWNGHISNFRVIKGTAVYTSSFRPPTEPLTSITNTKLLCCNNSSTTGSTTTSGTITANGDPTASTDSPFDDPAAFTFGEDGDQGIIKCGSYIGAGNNKINVNLGWEPQFVLIKNTSESSSWLMLDSTRGVVTDGNDARIYANKEDEEVTNGNHIDLTPTGFTVPSGATDSGHIVTYIAIRRPEGYVGKPASAGTDVFAMDGSPTNNFPAWNSGFPVDFAIDKKAAASGSWEVTSRFMVNNAYLVADTTAAEATYGTTDDGDWRKDSNTGFGAASSWGGASVYQAWMWKRHAGFDLVTDTGGGVAKSIPHSLGKVPEMIWRKSRSNAHGWTVYHKGLNGGTTPQNYWLQLSSTDAEGDADNVWNDTAPTSTHFTVGNGQWASDNGATFITMLFASVDGISKVGSYTGNTSSATNSVTTGFQPRFVILKRTDSATEGDWYVYDTTRNWVSLGSNSQRLQLNNDDAQANCGTCVEPTSTGFNLGSSGRHNTNNGKYIYYAHA